MEKISDAAEAVESAESQEKAIKLKVSEKRFIGRIMAVNALFQIKVGGVELKDARENAFSSIDSEFLEHMFAEYDKEKLLYVVNELGYIESYLKDEDFIRFVHSIVDGVYEHSEELEKIIDDRLVNWQYLEIGNTEAVILKIAVFEMLYGGNIYDIVPEVAIEQAVRLGKLFCYKEGGKFINGVLASVYKDMKAGAFERNDDGNSEDVVRQ
ncbi:MAG: hypothetical protein MJ234_05700 [bacterium]|nr:hypothetical protein [bacterium]